MLPRTGDASPRVWEADMSAAASPDIDWVRELTGEGRVQDDAVRRLHGLLVAMARREACRRGPRFGIVGPELDDLAQQAADDALLHVVAKVATFRGESKFTTWAYSFVIFELSAKLGRHYWRRPTVSMDATRWELLPERFAPGPAEDSVYRELLEAVRRAVEHELTPHQRLLFVAIVLNGVPLDAMVARLGTTRGAVYKTVFDARRKIRANLVANRYLDTDSGGTSRHE
jgi:RNA polymerase sigma-70 factor (ECF subfamily)